MKLPPPVLHTQRAVVEFCRVLCWDRFPPFLNYDADDPCKPSEPDLTTASHGGDLPLTLSQISGAGTGLGCRTGSRLRPTEEWTSQTAAASGRRRRNRCRLLSSSLEVAFKIRLLAQKAFNYRGVSGLPPKQASDNMQVHAAALPPCSLSALTLTLTTTSSPRTER